MLNKVEFVLDKLSPYYSLKDVELEIRIKTSNNIDIDKFKSAFFSKLKNTLTDKQKNNFDFRVEGNSILLIVSYYDFNNVKKHESKNQLKMIL